MSRKLLIVESPAKAKTIGKYLGPGFSVKSSVGHVRDLPKDNSAIKIVKTGDEKWEFIPTYEVSEGKEKVVSELEAAVKRVSEIYLASDPDREGEAIAWHLKELLAPAAGTKPFKRVTYNEITKAAVLKAVESPRDIDMPLVDAQQSRRILDRLVGYKVSPLLWKNINCANNRTLSAGRVQSVALRLLVERQREIEAFKPVTYFLMGVEARKPGDDKSFAARLSRFDGEKPDIHKREDADRILLDLSGASLEVTDLKAQPKTRHALPPFTTSTLQQAASSVLGMSPGRTMKLAQTLYEQGHITYMRSDSVNVSEQARAAAKDFIMSTYGEAFYPEKPNFFKSKSSAQEAHEAIRPTDVNLTPANANLEAQELKLYTLIWKRFIASQMADARTTVKTIALSARKVALAHTYDFSASATMVDFEGFLKVMKLSLKKKAADGEDDEDTDEVDYLPEVKVGDTVEAVRWISDEKQTKGPKHYSEASLIKTLEENGVGRPSTYAATIETLKTRGYAKTEKKKLVPLERGILVCDWLVKKMNSLFSVGYTAEMEAELDKVEEQGVPMNDMLSKFYAKFLKEIDVAGDPPPDPEKFTLVFNLLSQVSRWKPAKKIGKRTYDDKAFYESVKSQADEGKRPLSARQLQCLVKMAMAYADQIASCAEKLKDAGLSAGVVGLSKADEELTKYCFDVMDRVPASYKNSFIISIKEQWSRGKPLSGRQFNVLAKATYDAAEADPECQQIREKLASFAGDKIANRVEDMTLAPRLIAAMKQIRKYLPVNCRNGMRGFDDEAFIKSVTKQYEERHMLTARQVSVLQRIVKIYKLKIPDADTPQQAD